MTDSVRPTNPPAGYTSVTPYLVVDGAARAIDFYTATFGATLFSRNDGPNGRVAHAELQFPSGRLQLSDPLPDMNLLPPDGTNTVNHSYVLYCDDVDHVWRAAVDAGATPFEEPRPSSPATGTAPCSTRSATAGRSSTRSMTSTPRRPSAGSMRGSPRNCRVATAIAFPVA